MLVAALLLLYLSPFTHATSASPRITLANSVSAYTSKSRLLASAPANQPISLAIGLNLRNAANLDSYLQEITNPQSPLYRRYLNPASFTALYGPLPQSEAAVSAFLSSQGFRITATYPNHLVVDAVGTVAQAEQAFQVQINNYHNANAPTLPAQIGPLVATVSGLDNTIKYHRRPVEPGQAPMRLGAHPLRMASVAGAATTSCPQPGSSIVPTAYTPSQIATAYDFTRLYNAKVMGEGQTVGLLELDGFSSSDIAAYTACFGGGGTNIRTIPIDGFNGVPGVNAAEVALDIETILGLAPHLATLRVYEASATSLTAYNDAWARIVSDVTPVVSTSWVFCEQGTGMAAEIQQENIFFQAAAAQGQTILAASGDRCRQRDSERPTRGAGLSVGREPSGHVERTHGRGCGQDQRRCHRWRHHRHRSRRSLYRYGTSGRGGIARTLESRFHSSGLWIMHGRLQTVWLRQMRKAFMGRSSFCLTFYPFPWRSNSPSRGISNPLNQNSNESQTLSKIR